MRLWLDDIRRPPDEDWVWARTVEQAVDAVGFAGEKITHMSLDHDLGLHELDPDQPGAHLLRGDGEMTGLDFVRWLISVYYNERAWLQNEFLDVSECEFTIHSYNPIGARRMADELRAIGLRCYIEPYKVS